MKRLKKRLNWEDLSKLTNEELYAIHAKIFKCDPILHGRGAFYPQNEAERKAVINAIISGEPLDVTKDDLQTLLISNLAFYEVDFFTTPV